MAFVTAAAAVCRIDKHMAAAVFITAPSAKLTLVVIISVAAGLSVPVRGIKGSQIGVVPGGSRPYHAVSVCISRLIAYGTKIICRLIAAVTLGIVSRNNRIGCVRYMTVKHSHICKCAVAVYNLIAAAAIIKGACESAAAGHSIRSSRDMAFIPAAAAV